MSLLVPLVSAELGEVPLSQMPLVDKDMLNRDADEYIIEPSPAPSQERLHEIFENLNRGVPHPYRRHPKPVMGIFANVWSKIFGFKEDRHHRRLHKDKEVGHHGWDDVHDILASPGPANDEHHEESIPDWHSHLPERWHAAAHE